MTAKTLSALEEKIFNCGERLIPNVTHNIDEFIRHRSSYVFFRRVIEYDLSCRRHAGPIRILDLGCGVGHGCGTLADIKHSQIVGIDSSQESIQYAELHYSGKNITYQISDLVNYIPSMPEFDYIVSRNVFEHLPDGLHLGAMAKWRFRMLFDVPYAEPRGRNPHHCLFNIDEASLSIFQNIEIFYQDLTGIVYDIQHKPEKSKINIIMGVCSQIDSEKIAASNITFPVVAWKPKSQPIATRLGKLRLYPRRSLRLMRSVFAKFFS